MSLQFDENGLQVRQLAEILADWETRFTRIFGAGTQVSQETQSNISKMLAEFADRDALIEEGLESVYLSAYPSTAGGISFDRVAEITGHTRQGATKSILINTIFAAGVPSTAILSGELTMSVLQAGDLFINTSDFTLGILGDESVDFLVRSGTTVTAFIFAGHSYPLDSWIFIEGADQVEYNVLAQITAVTPTSFEYEISGVLPATPATGTLLAREATPFSAESVEEGTIQALQGALNVIEVTPSGDLDRVENTDDAILGNLVETTPEFRERRNLTLGALGGGTPEAIKGIILDVPGVSEVIVFINDTDFVDINGLSPHSVEVLVTGGADQDIFDALTGNASQKGAVSGGIRQHGNITGTVLDSSGNLQPSAFSRLAQIQIRVITTIETNSDPTEGPIFPGNGKDLIIDNLSALKFAGRQDVTRNIIKTFHSVDPLTNILNVPGITRIDILFDKIPVPITDTTVVILPTEQANIDSGDISGTIDGVPI